MQSVVKGGSRQQQWRILKAQSDRQSDKQQWRILKAQVSPKVKVFFTISSLGKGV